VALKAEKTTERQKLYLQHRNSNSAERKIKWQQWTWYNFTR